MSNTTPPGWYPDSIVPGQIRYWDGSQWTQHIAPAAPGGPIPPAQAPGGVPIAEPKNWFVRHKIITGLLALTVLIVVASSLGGGGDDQDPLATEDGDATQSETPESSDDGGGDADGDGARQMHGTWEVHIDPDRTVKLELNGSFDVYEDKADADAGETDIKVETFGTITATNLSDGRNLDGIGTGLELFVPIETCPDWEEFDPKGTHCSRDLVSFDTPDLDIGESEEIDISGTEDVTSVATDDARTVMDAMLGDSGVVVSADRVFSNQYLEKLNPTCQLDSDSKWVTYFTEDETVTACSTEVGGS